MNKSHPGNKIKLNSGEQSHPDPNFSLLLFMLDLHFTCTSTRVIYSDYFGVISRYNWYK